ncbi:T9SS type B sorting domain-containing protein [Hymenobacter terrenus]|uniref:T9SS type B sorting domain-containing protein n=1 Tax=Hymenobacter terrenus TaxID=1629124 RepID=UPI0018CCB3E1|nr:gliding motility-associated C-terminal domain-containing protein [Hymenobacter terrenus]
MLAVSALTQLRRLNWGRALVLSVAMLALGLPGRLALAQGEFDNWYFGYRAGISFVGGTARALSDGVMTSGESSAAISDAQGNLLFYTNGVYAWNRLHRRLVNGSNLGAFSDSTRTEWVPNSATQGVVVVPRPGSTTEYYIFTVDAAENGLVGGLRYSVVDMARQGGLGEVISKATSLAVPVGDGRLTEKLLAVRHANQRDIWIMVHAWNSNVFVCYLLTDRGIVGPPVLSAGGTIHQGGYNPRRDYNAIGYMKVSRDGRKLAVAQYNTNDLELFDFNYGTGIVSNPRLLGQQANAPGFYGVEFSPDGNLLYASFNGRIRQFNLLTRTDIDLLNPYGVTGALQLGPDQKIYVARADRISTSTAIYPPVGVIESPNIPGVGCGYRANGLAWGNNRGSALGLPNLMVRPPVPNNVLVNFGLLGTDVCQGEVTSVTASVFPTITDAVFTWDFGDPANPNNTATGPTAQHRYARQGSYVITMTMREVSGTVRTYTQTARILPRGQARLQVNSANVCTGGSVQLTVVPAQPIGSVYRWQDGSTASQLQANSPGVYWVVVTPPQQCPITDTIRIASQAGPTPVLKPEFIICAEPNLLLDPGPQPPGTTYRWQDGSTGSQLSVVAAGRYSVKLTTLNGCSATAETTVRYGEDCPYKIPNIITPNHDSFNDFFVLQGLDYRELSLQVFNRWGVRVYQQEHYDNRWDASGQPDGVYYYRLVNTRSGRQFNGWVEVIH